MKTIANEMVPNIGATAIATLAAAVFKNTGAYVAIMGALGFSTNAVNRMLDYRDYAINARNDYNNVAKYSK